MPLYLTYRPESFDEFFGNEQEVSLLKDALAKEEMPHSFFITGPPGCGKTTLARIIAYEMKIAKSDIHEYNTANTRGIDTIREINYESDFLPNESKMKMYLMDEAAKLTSDALNALLKLLEEKKPHVLFALATAEPEKITGTIKKAITRRCFQVNLKPLKPEEIIEYLEGVLLSERKGAKSNTLAKIAEVSDGSLGMALNHLDKIIDILDDEEACLLSIETVASASVLNICRVILDEKLFFPNKWKKMQQELKALEGQNAEEARYGIMGYFRKVLLGDKTGAHEKAASVLADLQMANFMYSGMSGLTGVLYFICKGDG